MEPMITMALSLIASTAMAWDDNESIADKYDQPYQTPPAVMEILNEPPKDYGYSAPVPVMPMERGVYYNSNRYGSVYSNPRTGVFCQSNRYSSTCF